MKKLKFILLLLIFVYGNSLTNTTTIRVMNISIDSSFSPEVLVRDSFIKGNCDNVSNIESFGSNLGVGYFSNAENIIGLSSGIIISTGKAEDAEGPNENVATSTAFNDSGDIDLDDYATSEVFDATGIEFDFVPLSDKVSFRYVFASEEYCEFAFTVFNDNFGFFVSGPGINGDFSNNAINAATLPNSTIYVSIKSVNHFMNPDWYVQNELPDDASTCGIPFNAAYLNNLEFDGFTIPFTATIDVIPCETYHIRLVVGDVADDKLDSAVFFESKSLNLGGEVIVTAKSEGSDEPIAYEDCRNGAFVFTRRSTLNNTQPLTVNFTINPSSDATPGVDYEALPNSITIPANQNEVVLPVNIIADALPESPEFIRLVVQYDCDCIDSTQADLFIEDLQELEGTFEEIYVCPDQEFSVGPTLTGGVAPYSFIWNTNDTTQLLTETVAVPTQFTVTITDVCGATAIAIAEIGTQPPPTATLIGNAVICDGDTSFLQVVMEGNPPWGISYDIDGVAQPPIENIYNNPFTLPVLEMGEYELTNFQDAFCEGFAEGIGNATTSDAKLDFILSPTSCPGIDDGNVSLDILGGMPPYSILWNTMVNDELNPTNLAAGDYQVSVTDANNCLLTKTITIPFPENYDSECLENLIYIPNAFSPNDDGYNDFFTLHVGNDNFIQNIKSVKIFNRWGAVVFATLNVSPSGNIELWDGYYKGRKMNSGVFVWVVELELLDGRTGVLSGDVSLIK